MYHALSELEQNLREHGYQQPMLVNHNSGGMAQLNSTDALQTIHSGPVSGVSASEHLAKQAGLGNVVATDMGGTSFDIGLVPGDGVKHYDFMPVIDRWLVSVPMIHLVTLGAGEAVGEVLLLAQDRLAVEDLELADLAGAGVFDLEDDRAGQCFRGVGHAARVGQLEGHRLGAIRRVFAGAAAGCECREKADAEGDRGCADGDESHLGELLFEVLGWARVRAP